MRPPEHFDIYPVCEVSGIGKTSGGRYSDSKQFVVQDKENVVVNVSMNNMQLYGICCGFNGGLDVATFVANGMVHAVYSDNPINMSYTCARLRRMLKSKFETIAASYRESLDDFFEQRKLLLQDPIKNKVELQEIESKLSRGTTAIFLLHIDNNIHVLHCGGSNVALTISDNKRGKKEASRRNLLNHNKDDPEEQERLRAANIDPHLVTGSTRAVGDFLRSDLYKDHPDFFSASSAPIIAEPDVVTHPVEIGWKFLLLLSDGVVQNVQTYQHELVTRYFSEDFTSSILSDDSTISKAAQHFSNHVAREHSDAYYESGRELHTMSNFRAEQAIVLVKLADYEICEDFDSTMGSMNTSLTLETMEAIEPYVDIPPGLFNENLLSIFED